MTIYKTARWIRNGEKETAFHEEVYTSSLVKAVKLFELWRKDTKTSRLIIWKSEHGCTEPYLTSEEHSKNVFEG